jgi:hypothetical protein
MTNVFRNLLNTKCATGWPSVRFPSRIGFKPFALAPLALRRHLSVSLPNIRFYTSAAMYGRLLLWNVNRSKRLKSIKCLLQASAKRRPKQTDVS